ncbi:hypothetical protein Cs7R123_31720 [Catellatospora sp. TT07R-123]|uniref:hypothetical protein n=1 Tax=Catellatospora sp. TT07R-123 TaxID=2733863 RepID=UPI001B0E1DA9|nr:hypothetical protein [Catellatospora sp. TT07R-123]GHJ45830.1 hypothetical protein Cs7R123_31720 [Catellatospora sp. TT07R-123]
MAKSGRSLAMAPLWLITLLGATLTVLGVYVQSTAESPVANVVAGTLAALGGGVIGATISLYFAAGEGRDALYAVRELLAGSFAARIRSAEADLKPVRQVWHYYYLTERGGAFLWRYWTYRFDQGGVPSSLATEITDISNGKEHVYRVEVGVRGGRMIMVESPAQGNEPPIIAVTPNFTEVYQNIRAGVVLLKSWDGNDLLTKCLWSTSPLARADGLEVVVEDEPILEDVWDRVFGRNNRIFPSTRDGGRNVPRRDAGGSLVEPGRAGDAVSGE